VCAKDPEERCLIRTLLQQVPDREIISGETDQVSEVKLAAELGKLDVVVLDIDTLDTFGYWLEQIMQNHLAPVVVLTERWTEEETTELLPQEPVAFLFKRNLSRNQLLDAIDGTVDNWQAVQRTLAHRNELDRLSNFDGLTGLLNRRSILNRLEEATARAKRYDEELSVVLLDVDNFRKVNEGLGRPAGDQTLQAIAALLKRRIREADLAGRYGGDEFLLVLAHTTRDGAQFAAERVRKLVEELELKDHRGEKLTVTVSAGVAAYEPGDDIASITYRAENCLCRAKDNGRNRVER